MAPDFKKVRNILHLTTWVLAIVAGVLIANLDCFKCGDNYMQNQFIVGVLYGYLTVTTLLFVALLAGEDIPDMTLICLYFGGGALYAICAILMLLLNAGTSNTYGLRVFCAGVFSAGNGVIFLFCFTATLVKKELLD